jgi:hypothetical protein
VLCVVQVEVSVTGFSLIQTSFTDCGVSEYDLETSAKTPTSVVEP